MHKFTGEPSWFHCVGNRVPGFATTGVYWHVPAFSLFMYTAGTKRCLNGGFNALNFLCESFMEETDLKCQLFRWLLPPDGQKAKQQWLYDNLDLPLHWAKKSYSGLWQLTSFQRLECPRDISVLYYQGTREVWLWYCLEIWMHSPCYSTKLLKCLTNFTEQILISGQ